MTIKKTDQIPNKSLSKLRILNIGNSKTIKVISIVKIIEKILKTQAKKEFLPPLRGDVGKTYADNKNLKIITKKKLHTSYYDGIKKNKTKIKDNVFIGSNSSLVAPLTIEENSMVGAGSVITKNVKKKSLALTRSLQTEIKNYKRKSK